MSTGPISKKDLLAEGKTKKIFSVKERDDLVLVESKDRLTAFGGAKSHELEGKARLATLTTCKVFEFLRAVGIKSHFVEHLSDVTFLARKCTMIPIEFVIRRVATGSFLKRHVHVKEGYRFSPPKLETFFKVCVTPLQRGFSFYRCTVDY
jgi:phosphoribosylaminoimidazole carboxylase/phosphoribosylaminoimidazole-succinocarboxamide synthase